MFAFTLAELKPIPALVVGLGSNVVGVALLLAVGQACHCELYCAVALGLQWGVACLHGVPRHSERYYDVSGSLTHGVLVMTALLTTDCPSTRGLIASAMTLVWSTRLGSFLWLRILRDGRDRRFDAVKTHPLRFLGAWTTQAVWVVLLQLPVILIHQLPAEDQQAIGVADVVGWSLWGGGILLETVSDMQKTLFRNVPSNREKFITTGLWAHSRHPNFLGELLLWTGICLSAAATGAPALGWLSLAVTALLLCGVSGIPPIEADGELRWGHLPAYRHYVAHTNRLLLGRSMPKLNTEPKCA